MGGGNPYLQIALFVGGQVMQARAAKGARDVRLAQAETENREISSGAMPIAKLNPISPAPLFPRFFLL